MLVNAAVVTGVRSPSKEETREITENGCCHNIGIVWKLGFLPRGWRTLAGVYCFPFLCKKMEILSGGNLVDNGLYKYMCF